MAGVIGVTGTPGTGKKTLSPRVAEALGVPCIGINSFAAARGLVDEGSEGAVDTDALREALSPSLRRGCVVYGHLLPFAVAPSALSRAVVLRCEPSTLKQRLTARRYDASKVVVNVEAELIGTVFAETLKAFGAAKTSEVDTTRSSPAATVAEILAAVKGDRPATPPIDWLPGYGTGARLRDLLSPG